MSVLLAALLTCYAVGVVLPACLPRRPKLQNFVAHGLACAAGLFGAALGMVGLVASEPLTASISSSIPYLSFAVRLDPLAAFFILTISVVGFAASMYAVGYVTEFYRRSPLCFIWLLLQRFLFSI